MLRIATWNVNSIKPRLEQVCAWLRETSVDIALLQETKVIDDAFPAQEIEDLGYNLAVHGQKTYNGVAILSKYPLEDITRGLPGMEDDPQARYIEAVVSLPGAALRVASVYVPNGQEVGSEKFAYKLHFFDALQAHAQGLLRYDEILVLGGDYNVAPEAADVYDPASLEGTVCFHADERAAWRRLRHLGLYDAFRLQHPHKAEFSWWDYRGNGWKMNKGLRIDHLLLSPQAADTLQACEVHTSLRDQARPSDHAPVQLALQCG